jgi:asparagine synthase (glutamine-hydrolysing)
MCGFAGEVSASPGVDAGRLERMARVLMHRGPDEGGVHVAPHRRWGVAHRRLRILDPEGGRQPFLAPERGLALVFNGEVYEEDRLRDELAERGWNFRSRSDTEVVLALYALEGLDFVHRLRGEFALVVVDERERRAVLVRDRLGLKPLYYTAQPGFLTFASEIKALFQDERVERAFLAPGLAASVAIADRPGRTPFTDIAQVPNGHRVVVDLDSLETSVDVYWDAWAQRRTDAPERFEDQVAAVREAVDEAIDIRLRADVPLGLYLSGGLDSSIVAARVARRLDRVHAFGMSFRSSAEHDEFGYARAVAEMHPNIELHEIPITPENALAALPRAAWHMERPVSNLHVPAKLIAARTVKQRLGCVLTGDGGDEAFCGYPTFRLQAELERSGYNLRRLRSHVRELRRAEKGVGENLYYLEQGAAVNLGRRRALLVEKAGFCPADLANSLDNYRAFKFLMRPEFFRRIAVSPAVSLAKWLEGRMPAADAHPHAEILQYIHLAALGPEYIAAVSDRTESGGSIEARHPLFDHRVVELAAGLPIESKVGKREKHVLREAYRDVLPPAVAERRKHAFLLPPTPYRSRAEREVLERYANPRAVRDAGVFRPGRVRAFLAASRVFPNSRLINKALNAILTTQVLHHHFIVDPAAAPPELE